MELSDELYQNYKDKVSKMRSAFIGNSLILFNLNCVDYYNSGKICVSPFDYEGDERPGSYEIKLDSVKKRILKK